MDKQMTVSEAIKHAKKAGVRVFAAVFYSNDNDPIYVQLVKTDFIRMMQDLPQDEKTRCDMHQGDLYVA